MTTQATLYEDARIDAGIVAAVTGVPEAPFWRQMYTGAIHRARSVAILTGNGEPSLEEAGALLDNNAVLEALVKAGTATNPDSDDDRSNYMNQEWLRNDWQRMDRNLRHHIADSIRRTAASRLEITEAEPAAPATRIGERRGRWLDNGRLRWNISRLPATIKAAILNTVDELNHVTDMAETAEPGLPERNDPMNPVRLDVLTAIEKAAVAASSLRAITLSESTDLKNKIAEWRARLQPAGKQHHQRTSRRTTPRKPKAGRRPARGTPPSANS